MKHILVVLTFLSIACNPVDNLLEESLQLVDQNATKETKALYINLKKMSGTGVMFGHQDDLAYGYHWMDEAGRSDVKEASGSYPAVYGWDVGDISDEQRNLDGIDFEKMKNFMKLGYERGGVISISWHMVNPVTMGDPWDYVETLPGVLPGGEAHELFKSWLDNFAEFSLSLKGEQGELIPIIFRPYHEHNGDWFWWGKGANTEEDYIALWRFTVEYLRDEKRVHNLLWAFSPDRSRMDINSFKEDYFYGYPGDEYVDIIGFDNYWDVGHPANETDPGTQQENFVRSLTYTAQIADSLNKVFALTETGTEALPVNTIWSERFLAALTANEWTRKTTYMLTWRNANFEKENRDHYYASFEGHPTQEDFKKFKEHEFILFEDELPDMYTIKNE